MARKTFIRPSFGRGVARTLAVNGGISFRPHTSGAFIERDDEAFAADWAAISGDLRTALDVYASRAPRKPKMNGHG